MRRYCFKLALALGKDVREILEWPSPLVSEWMAYDQLDGIPDHAWLAGMNASTMVNLWSKTRTRPEDFIPRVRATRRQSVQEQLALFRGIAAAQEARVKRGC